MLAFDDLCWCFIEDCVDALLLLVKFGVVCWCMMKNIHEFVSDEECWCYCECLLLVV